MSVGVGRLKELWQIRRESSPETRSSGLSTKATETYSITSNRQGKEGRAEEQYTRAGTVASSLEFLRKNKGACGEQSD